MAKTNPPEMAVIISVYQQTSPEMGAASGRRL